VTGHPTVSTGTSDCELRDEWLLEQDVNAWSSLAYVAAGLLLAWEVRRARLPRAVYGLAGIAVAEGFGSLLYHGAASDVGQFLHDVPLIGALAFVAGWHTGRLRERADAGSLVGLAIGLAISAAVWAFAPGATNVAVAVTVGVIVVASLIARRRAMSAVWSLPLVGLGGVALATWALGTPDSPVCDADSWLQPHGLWHVLTAVLALAWVDRAYAAADPAHAPRLFRRFTDRTLGLAARGIVLAFHRSVDVHWRERLPRDRPVVIVANHGNGFVDPVVVAGVLGRLPRFLAKAALWKVAVARPFLWLAGVLPVYRTGDGDRATDNASVFDACHRELAQRSTVAIFPEGTTGDRAQLDRVKSGAARIALGALPTAPDVVIVPIGMAFESTVETRSRAVVMFGEPIEVAEFEGAGLDGDGEPDRTDAAALTDAITAALEQVSPQFADLDEREMLRAAAREERSEASGRVDVPFGDAEVVARRLAGADPASRQRVMVAYRDFATRLQLLGITARQLRPERVSIARLVLSAVVLLLAGSLVVTVTAVHLPAIFVVVVGTGLVRSTATKGTVRILLGLVTFVTTWTLMGMWLGDGWVAVLNGVAVAIGGVVAMVVWPPLVRQAVVLMGRVRVRDRVGLVPPVLAARSAVAVAVRESESDGDDDHT
jgi:glycerol-3-phosphate O-acyltransferase / dihydroxyacetone phosphate acyltransferase